MLPGTAGADGIKPEKSLNRLLTVLPERFTADPLAAVFQMDPYSRGTGLFSAAQPHDYAHCPFRMLTVSSALTHHKSIPFILS